METVLNTGDGFEIVGRGRESRQATAASAERSARQVGRNQPHAQRLRFRQEETVHREL